jgi:hypothetical protein
MFDASPGNIQVILEALNKLISSLGKRYLQKTNILFLDNGELSLPIILALKRLSIEFTCKIKLIKESERMTNLGESKAFEQFPFPDKNGHLVQ